MFVVRLFNCFRALLYIYFLLLLLDYLSHFCYLRIFQTACIVTCKDDQRHGRFLMGLCFEADPRLTDYDTLLQNIHDLKAGNPVQVPMYDFKSSSRVGYR